jgi:hypothetical protein
MRVDQLVAKLQDRGVNCNTLTISSLRLSPMRARFGCVESPGSNRGRSRTLAG